MLGLIQNLMELLIVIYRNRYLRYLIWHFVYAALDMNKETQDYVL